jgi:hypothetical protein
MKRVAYNWLVQVVGWVLSGLFYDERSDDVEHGVFRFVALDPAPASTLDPINYAANNVLTSKRYINDGNFLFSGSGLMLLMMMIVVMTMKRNDDATRICIFSTHKYDRNAE